MRLFAIRHHPALDRVVFHYRVGPFAELHSTFVVHLKSHSDNHLQTVVLHFTCHLPHTFRLNYSEIPNGCLSAADDLIVISFLFAIFYNSLFLLFSIHSRDHLATILNVTDGCFYNSTSPTLSPSNMPVVSSHVLCDAQRTHSTFRDGDSLLSCKDNR